LVAATWRRRIAAAEEAEVGARTGMGHRVQTAMRKMCRV
jgi:hypothetical protein